MSVISKNPFDLLDDEGDDTSSPAPTIKAAAPAPAAQQPKVVPGAQPKAGNQRGGRYPSRGGPRNTARTGDRNGALPSSEGVAEGMETAGGFDGERVPPPRKAHHGPDSHTKGPRGSRPARGSGHAAARIPALGGERRQYERRSGTYGDSEKKIAHGWGADEGEAELSAEVAGEKDAIAEESTPQTPAPEGEADDGGWGAPEDLAPAVPAAPVVPQEPEEVLKSYDEYLAEKAAQALGAGLGKKEGRKVEGESVEGKAFRREAIDDFFSGKEKTSVPKQKTAKKEKVFLEFEGRFAPPAGSRPPRGEGGERSDRGGRGRGGPRGGRGGDRGSGRGRGAPRGAPRGGPAPVDANDEKAFPALGA